MFRHCFSLFLLCPTLAHAAIFCVGGASDTARTHATLQAALNAAAASPGEDLVRVSRSASYTAQAVVIQNQDVSVIGGYANCIAIRDTTWTRIDGGGGSANSVIAVRGSGSVTLATLDITGGDEVSGSYGGGIEISGGVAQVARLVYLENVRVAQNTAGYGGGISVEGIDVTLRLGIDVTIQSNQALQRGGGLYCRNDARVLMLEQGSAAFLNNAVDGAGMRLENCVAEIASGGAFGGLFPALSSNTASASGGGLSATGERTLVFAYTRDAQLPVRIANNTAGTTGGGIAIGSSARVALAEAIVDLNVARAGGGGIYQFDNDGPPANRFSMQGTLNGFPDGAVRCAPELACNRISDNRAESQMLAREGAALLSDSQNEVVTNLYGTRITGNSGLTTLGVYGDFVNFARLNGVALSGNSAIGALLSARINGSPRAYLYLTSTTIAGNFIAGPSVIATGRPGVPYDPLIIDHSIIWQPGKPALIATGPAVAGDVTHLVTNDATGLEVRADIRVLDPRFADADNGDFRLAPGSPALDAAPAKNDHTVDAGPRTVDLVVADYLGPQDLGAWERATLPPDALFADGFED